MPATSGTVINASRALVDRGALSVVEPPGGVCPLGVPHPASNAHPISAAQPFRDLLFAAMGIPP
ncbi:hypothetical protein [Amycolatopsis xylanica]|uniref:hypothetical protein n=1 Tax=Amycolatopsis xylanica TaxID=589385 RepID=UPI001FE0561A|nr:hypothetical protein [Amycolatopsis xylanica]